MNKRYLSIAALIIIGFTSAIFSIEFVDNLFILFKTADEFLKSSFKLANSIGYALKMRFKFPGFDDVSLQLYKSDYLFSGNIDHVESYSNSSQVKISVMPNKIPAASVEAPIRSLKAS